MSTSDHIRDDGGDGPTDDVAAVDASSPWSAWPLRVLLVEDDPGDERLMCEALEDSIDHPVVVHSVGRLSLAVQALRATRFDCVLLDLGLPDSSGLGGLGAVLETQPGVAVLVVTGRNDDTLGLEAVRRGAQDYLSKQTAFGPELHRLVGYAVERSRSLLRERRLALLLERASEVVLVIGTDMVVSYASASSDTMFGRSAPQLLGAVLSDLIHDDDVHALRSCVAAAIEDDRSSASVTIRARQLDRSYRWYEVDVANLLHDAAVEGLVVGARDITDRKQAEQSIELLAYHDALTGLPNRTRLTTLLDHALAAAQDAGERVAVVVADLDHFKAINDNLGHATGDELLAAVARRLDAALEPGETLARFGGDEFALLVQGNPDVRRCGILGDRVAAALGAPVSIGTGDYRLSLSGGIALSDAHSTADTLLRDADTALFHAKDVRRGRLAMFDEGLQSRTRRRLDVELELRSALELGQLSVHYQPVVELVTQHTVGFEALLRWNHPTLGNVRPDEFIPIAEETGLIIPIGHWVLEQSLQRVAHWRASSTRAREAWVAVNLSGRQLEQLQLTARVAAALGRTGLPPEALHLEVTESVLMDNIEDSVASLCELRALGISMSVDDFGTGYSSLSYLKRLPLDTLKIDRSFVNGLGTDPEDTSIVQAIVSLAKALRMSVLAEGVENRTQLNALCELGCEQAQGFLWSPALDPDRVVGWLDGVVDAAAVDPVTS